MGNISFNKTCCTSSCKNETEFKDDFVLYKQFSTEIIKLQSRIRGYLYRSKLKINLIRADCKDKISNPNIDKKSIPGVIIDPNFEPNFINEKVKELEKKLGPFHMNEKESYILSFSNLKKYFLLYKDNSMYKGYFNKDWQKEGFGVLYLPDGSKYEGFFHKDTMFGRGRLININGFYYEGSFSDNKANGFGRYVTNEGSIYVGYWKNDQQHGLGEEVFPDGSRYEGQFEYGKKNGRGLFIFQDNSRYEGDFQCNAIEGYGTYTWNDGRIYQGSWINNKMDGKGIFLWPDKKKYIGYYKNDKKHGYGIFIWPDGKKYEGNWQNGKQHGFGIFSQDYSNKIGEWESGKNLRWIEEDNKEYISIQKSINLDKLQSKLYDEPEIRVRIL